MTPGEIVKPRRLTPGDRVAVVSLGWGGPHTFPAVFEAGLATLERFGCEIVEMPSARRATAVLRADPRARAEDLTHAFADPSIQAIVTSIGGDDSARILAHLDAAVMRANPKILMGYSDTTAQLIYAHRQGLVTFHGPTVMAGLAQASRFPELAAHMRSILFEPAPQYEYRPYTGWVEGYPDWATGDDPTAVGERRSHAGWRWLNGERPARGRLVGGSFEVLEFLKGSRYWPEPAWWDGRLLFLETSELVPTPMQVRFWLFNYGLQGILERISGLLVGRARGYTASQEHELDDAIVGVVGEDFGVADLPIVTGMDFGHTDPQWILPLGCEAEIDPCARTFRLLEPAVV